ncbi:DUF6891 domain-containing protein [Kitasatospora sp. LaBMicrA B282]|uniref:DUF6891 domain-containing protein n=1 Tax=Kitasatospora sp. LaBMicrA B282 TaxID=3420949 RepID=UPI003D14CBF3
MSHTTPTAELPAEVREQVERLARHEVYGGYVDFGRVVDEATDLLSDLVDEAASAADAGQSDVAALTPPAVHAHAVAVTTAVWQAHRTEQAGWPAVTDADRLATAFAALQAEGIAARQNFTCCSSCGFGEIHEYRDAFPRGFTFFHTQDTDRAVDGHGLYLAYGSFESEDVEDALAVGHRVVDALTAAGLSVQWDGSHQRRIHVHPLSWQKRRPSQ